MAMTDNIRLSQALKLSGLPVSLRTAAKLIAKGKVPGAVKIGGLWYCTPKQLLEAMVHIPGKG